MTGFQTRATEPPVGFPSAGDARQAHHDVDLNRAIAAYRFFYRSVSGAAIFDGTQRVGVRPNEVFGYMDTKPHHVGFTLNSDTPYGAMLFDLHAGPLVIDIPPGPLLGAVLDLHQGWICDVGIPGPDAGLGGRHLVLPPSYTGDVPDGYHVSRAESFRIIGGMRAVPERGDVAAASQLLRTITAYPLDRAARSVAQPWIDMTPTPQDITPLSFEQTIQFWHVLHDVVDREPPLADSRAQYGDLAALGIERGRPFQPDDRMTSVLEDAARRGSAQLRAESFADRRPDRVVWSDRQWEWASLRPENGSFDTPGYRDTHAVEKWFFQAIAASPAMFRRDPSAGSLYWLGAHDAASAFLDGAKNYTLQVPLPVPARLFWSITVYDAQTRSQIQTDQDNAALRSLFELRDLTGDFATLHFGPTPPPESNAPWIKTIPGRGWFAYFRIYGPQPSAFDGSWKPSDFR